MPSYREADVASLVESLFDTVTFIDGLDMGPLSRKIWNDNKFDLVPLAAILKAKTDDDLAAIMQNVTPFLRYFEDVIRVHALLDPPAADGEFSLARKALYGLKGWGAFMPVPATFEFNVFDAPEDIRDPKKFAVGTFKTMRAFSNEIRAHVRDELLDYLEDMDFPVAEQTFDKAFGALDGVHPVLRQWLDNALQAVPRLRTEHRGDLVDSVLADQPMNAHVLQKALEEFAQLHDEEAALELRSHIGTYLMPMPEMDASDIGQQDEFIKRFLEGIVTDTPPGSVGFIDPLIHQQVRPRPFLRGDRLREIANELGPYVVTLPAMDGGKDCCHLVFNATARGAQRVATKTRHTVINHDTRSRIEPANI